MKVKTTTKKKVAYYGYNLSVFPNFHISGSITGMKKMYYGKNALLVKCGNFVYNVSSEPEVYYNL